MCLDRNIDGNKDDKMLDCVTVRETHSINNCSLFKLKSIKEVNKKVAHGKINSQKRITNLVKLYYSAHNCDCEPICFCYKLCFTEKRTYLNRLKFPIL